MKQHNGVDENKIEVKEGLLIEMDAKEVRIEKALLPKKETTARKERSMRI